MASPAPTNENIKKRVRRNFGHLVTEWADIGSSDCIHYLTCNKVIEKNKPFLESKDDFEKTQTIVTYLFKTASMSGFIELYNYFQEHKSANYISELLKKEPEKLDEPSVNKELNELLKMALKSDPGYKKCFNWKKIKYYLFQEEVIDLDELEKCVPDDVAFDLLIEHHRSTSYRFKKILEKYFEHDHKKLNQLLYTYQEHHAPDLEYVREDPPPPYTPQPPCSNLEYIANNTPSLTIDDYGIKNVPGQNESSSNEDFDDNNCNSGSVYRNAKSEGYTNYNFSLPPPLPEKIKKAPNVFDNLVTSYSAVLYMLPEKCVDALFKELEIEPITSNGDRMLSKVSLNRTRWCLFNVLKARDANKIKQEHFVNTFIKNLITFGCRYIADELTKSNDRSIEVEQKTDFQESVTNGNHLFQLKEKWMNVICEDDYMKLVDLFFQIKAIGLEDMKNCLDIYFFKSLIQLKDEVIGLIKNQRNQKYKSRMMRTLYKLMHQLYYEEITKLLGR